MVIVEVLFYVILVIVAIVLWGRLIVFLSHISELRKQYKTGGKMYAKQIAKYPFMERIALNNAPKLPKRDFVFSETFFLRVLALYDDVRRALKAEGKWKRSLFFYECLYVNCRYALQDRFFMIPCPNDDVYTVTPPIQSIINEKRQAADPISDDDMRRFYYNNPAAWKYRYDLLKKNFTITGADAFFDEMRCLTNHLTAITAIRKVYYEMHEEMTGRDPVLSLRFYLLYYYHALNLSKPLSIKRVNRKLLFKDARQEQQFEKLCEEVKTGKDKFDEVLGKVASIYVKERKKLTLDLDGIKEADRKQARIAKTLGAYLADEESPHVDGRPIEQQRETPGDMPPDDIDTAMELIALFKCNEFYLDKQKVNIFAQAKGVMPGQLVESLNEKYYEILDDVLIEEDDSCYTIERDYYEQIIGQNGSEN